MFFFSLLSVNSRLKKLGLSSTQYQAFPTSHPCVIRCHFRFGLPPFNELFTASNPHNQTHEMTIYHFRARLFYFIFSAMSYICFLFATEKWKRITMQASYSALNISTKRAQITKKNKSNKQLIVAYIRELR